MSNPSDGDKWTNIASGIVSLFLTFLFVCFMWGGTSPAHAQTDEERIDAELPERVQIPVLDVTIVHLVPRLRFDDSSVPGIGEHYGRYIKERAWTLPPEILLGRQRRTDLSAVPELQVRLTAAPRAPGSFMYDALLTRNFSRGYGLVHLGQDFLSGSETTNSREYQRSYARAGIDYHHRQDASFGADVLYLSKALGWQLRPPTPDESSSESLERNTSFLTGNFRWTEPVGQASNIRVLVDASSYRLRAGQETHEQNTDVRLHTELTTPWPYLYPLRLGAMVEFHSAEESALLDRVWDATLFRAYVHDSLIRMGPFTADARLELAALWEVNEENQGERLYYPNPEVSLTTEITPDLRWKITGARTVERPRLDMLYVEHDYTVMQPQLKSEKSWHGEAALYFSPGETRGVLKAGVQRTDDLVIFAPATDTNVLAWRPAAMDARLYYASLHLDWHLTSALKFALDYRHEEHDPLRLGGTIPDRIPFRPMDQAEARLEYAAQDGWLLGVSGQYIGEQYTEALATTTEEVFGAYFLVRPSIRYHISESTEIYTQARFSIGEYRERPSYELPQHTADFGVTLRF